MSPAVITPLLAAGFEGWGFVIFIVIAIISWLTNLANQKKPVPPPPQPRQPRRPANDKLAQEIDIFLQEVTGRKRPSEAEPVEIEVVSDNEIRRRRAERRPSRSTTRRQPSRSTPTPQQRPPVQAAAAPTRHRPGQDLAERHSIDPSRLGTTLQSHLSTYMGDDRIDREVKQHLRDDVNQSVTQHLGSFGPGVKIGSVAAVSATSVPQTSSEIVRLLRDPAGVRQAILLNEVLGKPVGLRKR